MRRSLLPVVTLFVLGLSAPALAQTKVYKETWPEFQPKAFQGCSVLAPGASGPPSGIITKLSDLPPRLRAADKVRLRNMYIMAQHEVAMNPGGVELPAQAKPRVARLNKLHAVAPTACPDTVPLRLTGR
jgi:hypothetical protein